MVLMTTFVKNITSSRMNEETMKRRQKAMAWLQKEIQFYLGSTN